jgi:chromosome segregation ATPase
MSWLSNLWGVDLDAVVEQLNDLTKRVRRLEVLVVQLQQQEKADMAAIDDIKAQVQAAEDTEDKAVALLQSTVQALQTALANNDTAALQQLVTDLKTHTDALAAEVAKDSTPGA